MSINPDLGFSKFKYNLKLGSAIDEKQYIELEKWRTLFHKMGLIGKYPSKDIEFGSLSKRSLPQDPAFIINGTQTGKLAHLAGKQYTKIIKCDLKKATIQAIGPITPCQESYIHHAVYAYSPLVNFVFHIHNKKLWSFLENKKDNYKVDSNSGLMTNVENAIKKSTLGIFKLESESLGMIAYGKSSDEVGKFILDILKQSRA
jgi:hypothetical protein